jgi:uncharacterized protein YneR
MQVYSLLGFVDYEGQDLLGVFGSVEDLMKCVASSDVWYYDDMGYVVSELGQKVEDVLECVEYVEFSRYYSKSLQG